MIELRDKETGRVLGAISEQELRFLIDQLEEESSHDTDYYINTDTLEMFAVRGGDPHLLDLLREGLADREEMEIEWSRR